MSTVLFVVTGARSWTLSDGTSHPTGYWAEELLTPYRLLTDAGHEVVFATPGGVAPVADEGSLAADEDARDALAAIEGLQAPRRLDDIDLAAFDAVFYPGGHGPMEDLASDPTSGALLAEALETDNSREHAARAGRAGRGGRALGGPPRRGRCARVGAEPAVVRLGRARAPQPTGRVIPSGTQKAPPCGGAFCVPVDPGGFEPPTFSLRTRRATNCAMGP